MTPEPGFFSEVIAWFTDAARWSGSTGIPIRVLEHLEMSIAAVVLAALVALPAGLAIGHLKRAEFLVVSLANFGRAIPSFGLLIVFVILFGVGLDSPPGLRPSIIVVLTLLAIPPILTNTYVGIQTVDEDTLEAAKGMGMTGWGVLHRLEIPLAAPLMIAGLRTAAVQVLATATLAAVVAGGGLGRFIVDGFAVGDTVRVFSGALLVAVLAIITEVGFALLQRKVTPKSRTKVTYPPPTAEQLAPRKAAL